MEIRTYLSALGSLQAGFPAGRETRTENPADRFTGASFDRLVLAVHRPGNDAPRFFRYLPRAFDGIVLLNYEAETDLLPLAKDRNVLIINASEPAKDARKILVRIASGLSARWIGFLDTNETPDPYLGDWREWPGKDGVKALAVTVALTRDGQHYPAGKGRTGLVSEVRFYNTALCILSDMKTTDPRKLAGATPTDLLVVHRHTSGPFAGSDLFTPLLPLHGLLYREGKFENIEDIPDKALPKLLKEKTAVIARHLSATRQELPTPALYTGTSGIALYFAVLYLYTRRNEYREQMNRYIDQTTRRVESGVNLMSTFCNGLAGYGWLVCYLRDHDLLDVSEEYLRELDELLLEQMKRFCAARQFDQMHEAISLGRYFLRREDPEPLEYLVDALDAAKETEFDEIKWESFAYLTRTMKYDFGLAHGMAGILHFLGKCCRRGVRREKCLELIDGIYAFYRHNEQDPARYRSYHPTTMEKEGYRPGGRPIPCRLAWCYGDTGSLYSLYLCGRNIGHTEMQAYALERMKATARRRSLKETLIEDALFCHGSCSLAHIFNKMYFYTGDPEFADAARYWYKVTLMLGRSETTPTGYLFLTDRRTNEWSERDDLLEGNAGVGLALVSAFDYRHTDWDESMMLS